MSSEHRVTDGQSPAAEADGSESDGVERIADPDNYNVRRRLKQLHDAKERVREVKGRALQLQMTSREFTTRQRDRFVAEAVVDYINELETVLEQTDEADDFRQETVDVGDGTVTVEDFCDGRGSVNVGDGPELASFEVSMEVWRICNRHFERVAGTEFESKGLPHEESFDTTRR